MKTTIGRLIVAASVLVLFHLRCADSQCQNRNLAITVDNYLELYIDGVKKENLPNSRDWRYADTVPLPCAAQLIAVKGTDIGIVAGILASTDDGYLLTNSSWRCTSVFSAGWEQVGFVDSSWPVADQIVTNGERPWRYVEGIRRDAVWIWTQDYAHGDSVDAVVYCRRQLIPVLSPAPPRPSRTLVITVDNELRLWIDGTEKTNLPNADNWRRADTADLPWSSRVIAVQGTDDGAVTAGILASTQDGFILTNASWKCTNVYYSGWNQIGFDDSLWPAARLIAIHETPPWQYVGAIRLDAYWIWTSVSARVVYCRKNLVPYIPTTPRPICPSRKLKITVDNSFRLYINGIENTNLPNANNWKVADTVDLPGNTRVIAVQGTDDGIVATGILASTSDGYIMTNANWQCTNVYFSGWNQVGFDDSSWPAAYVIAIHQTRPWALISGIRTDAYWIGTKTNTRKETIVYCRKNLAIPPDCVRVGVL